MTRSLTHNYSSRVYKIRTRLNVILSSKLFTYSNLLITLLNIGLITVSYKIIFWFSIFLHHFFIIGWNRLHRNRWCRHLPAFKLHDHFFISLLCNRKCSENLDMEMESIFIEFILLFWPIHFKFQLNFTNCTFLHV